MEEFIIALVLTLELGLGVALIIAAIWYSKRK